MMEGPGLHATSWKTKSYEPKFYSMTHGPNSVPQEMVHWLIQITHALPHKACQVKQQKRRDILLL